jgi:hypothetical protein
LVDDVVMFGGSTAAGAGAGTATGIGADGCTAAAGVVVDCTDIVGAANDDDLGIAVHRFPFSVVMKDIMGEYDAQRQYILCIKQTDITVGT